MIIAEESMSVSVSVSVSGEKIACEKTLAKLSLKNSQLQLYS